jgi:hypothetical protein
MSSEICHASQRPGGREREAGTLEWKSISFFKPSWFCSFRELVRSVHVTLILSAFLSGQRDEVQMVVGGGGGKYLWRE